MNFLLVALCTFSLTSAVMAKNVVVLQEEGEFHSSLLTPMKISTMKSRAEALRVLKYACKRNYGGKIKEYSLSKTSYNPSVEGHTTIATGNCVY
jgi:hypothetical protein